jgi:hypothetical protein
LMRWKSAARSGSVLWGWGWVGVCSGSEEAIPECFAASAQLGADIS